MARDKKRKKSKKRNEPVEPTSRPLRDIVEVLDVFAPPALAQDWDNVGLLVGNLDAPVRSALLCIDLMPPVVDEAVSAGVELVVAYHPPLFRPVSRLVFPSDRMEAGIHRCIRNGIAIYSPHTALDAAPGGTNDVLADLCGVKSTEPLSPIPQPDGAPTRGIGRVGPLKKPNRLGPLASRLQDKLAKAAGSTCVSFVGDPDTEVRRAILCVGAAGSLPFEIEVGPSDVIVTGEIRHHDALRTLRAGATAIALSHWTSERPTLTSLAKRLVKTLPGLVATVSEADREPFQRA